MDSSRNARNDQRSLAVDARPNGARSASGQEPTVFVDLGDWVVQPPNARKQAKARKAAERAGARLTGEHEPVVIAAPSAVNFADEGMGMANGHAEVDQLEKLLAHLQDVPPDDGVEDLRNRYRERLDKLRIERNERQRDPTLQLLRAQQLTRKRERQRDAAAKKVATLETQMAQLRIQVEAAQTDAAKAEDIVAETRLQEESLRHNIASTSSVVEEPQEQADIAETISGLKTQLDALPSAFNSGNMDAAYAAMCAQFERVVVRLRGPSKSDDRTSTDPYVDCEAPDVQVAEPCTRWRPGADVHTSGRRVPSPAHESKSRSRSRSQESGFSSDQEGKLRKAANRSGQRNLRSWVAEAPRR